MKASLSASKTTLDPALYRILVFVMLLSMALVLHGLEAMLPPPLPFPGVKLGLANLMTVIAVIKLGGRAGVSLALLRSLLGGLILGTFLTVGFFLSLGGALASAMVVVASLRWMRPGLSLIGVSVLGAVTHNTVQLILAWAFFVQNGVLFFYLPVLWLLSLISGSITGLVLRALDKQGTLTTPYCADMLTQT